MRIRSRTRIISDQNTSSTLPYLRIGEGLESSSAEAAAGGGGVAGGGGGVAGCGGGVAGGGGGVTGGGRGGGAGGLGRDGAGGEELDYKKLLFGLLGVLVCVLFSLAQDRIKYLYYIFIRPFVCWTL